MYSYDDRLKAVKLYLKYGKRLNATIRELGYPTKNSLRAWCVEFEAKGVLEAGYIRSKQKYSDEQKNAAIEHSINHGRCLAFTQQALGYPSRQKLSDWVGERYPETKKSLLGRVGKPVASLTTKRAAVYELCTREGSAQDLASKLDVDRVTLYNWKNQLLGREAPASMKREKLLPLATDLNDLEQQVLALRRDIRDLQLEHDLLTKANELLKKNLGVDPQILSNQEKATLVDALRDEYPLRQLLERLEFPRSSYFYHRALLRTADKYAEVRPAITEIFENAHRSYGYRRIQAELNR